MTVITIDRSTGDKLRGLLGPATLVDDRGVFVGEFLPAAARSDDYAGLTSPHGEEELRRRSQEETVSTAEVLRTLEALR